jgi:alkylhydroperoxidase family enzyme
MLLRVSGQAQQTEVDLDAVHGEGRGDGGVAHGGVLIAFVEAVMGRDDDALDRARATARRRLGPAAFVDACAVIGAFNVVDRVADATGIPLDAGMAIMSAGVREELGLVRFASSANTATSD